MLDRAELDFRFDRPIRFVDLESTLSVVTEPAAIREQLARRFHGRLGAGRGGRIIGSGHIGPALASIRRCDAAQDTR